MVFLHGVGGDASSWNLQKAAVVKAGWRFVAIDCPGYGGTPTPESLTWADLRDAVSATLDVLGVARAVLVGHSMGGMVAQSYLAHRPERVRAAVLSATSPAFGKPDGDWQKAFIRDRFEPFDAQKMTMPDFAAKFVPGMVGESASPDGVAQAVRCMAGVPVETYKTAMQNLVTFEGRENLPKIAVPTLLIAGEQDKNAPLPVMKKMAGKIAGSETVVLPGIGHLANFEAPDAFNNAIVQFLSKV